MDVAIYVNRRITLKSTFWSTVALKFSFPNLDFQMLPYYNVY